MSTFWHTTATFECYTPAPHHNHDSPYSRMIWNTRSTPFRSYDFAKYHERIEIADLHIIKTEALLRWPASALGTPIDLISPSTPLPPPYIMTRAISAGADAVNIAHKRRHRTLEYHLPNRRISTSPLLFLDLSYLLPYFFDSQRNPITGGRG